jgi:hypothetical protein
MIREVIDIHVRAAGRVFADRSATVRVTWSNVNGRADRLTISIPAPASAAA